MNASRYAANTWSRILQPAPLNRTASARTCWPWGRPDSRKATTVEQSWPFDQAPNVAAITTRQVLEGRPILRVVHYDDDHSWAFTCGTTNDEADGRVISMEEAVTLDSTIREVSDLPPGWRAWRRAAGRKWQREQVD
jgi:hypothetical protein